MKEIIEANRSRIKAIIRKLTGSDNEDIEQEVKRSILPQFHHSGNDP